MEKIKKVPLGIWLLFMLITSMCILTAVGTYGWVGSQTEGQTGGRSLYFFKVANQSAKVVESLTLKTNGGPVSLLVDSQAGNITVVGSDREDILIEMVKTGWGFTDEDAKAIAEGLQAVIVNENGQYTITFSNPEVIGLFYFQGGSNKIDFKIQAPNPTELTLTTRNGLVSTNNTMGLLTIDVNFGDIDVNGHEGGLSVKNRNGKNTYRNVNAAGEEIEIDGNFGDISMDAVTAKNINIHSRNGKIAILNAKSENDIELNTNFGDVSLEDIESDKLLIDSRNGKISLVSGEVTTELSITTDFGDLVLEKITAPKTILDHKNGDLKINGINGKLTIVSNFGDIEIKNADRIILNIEKRNGKVEFYGSLHPDNAHRIQNEFGDVILHLPEDSAFDVSVDVQHGNFFSDFPVVLTGEIGTGKIDAQLNDGGPQLTILTRNGNILLSYLGN